MKHVEWNLNFFRGQTGYKSRNIASKKYVSIDIIHLRFRLAALQMDSLQRCRTPRELRQTLQSLPASLTEMYDAIISQICPERKKTETRLLQILAYAERPLLLDEIADAIVVNLDESPGFRPDQRMFNAKNLPSYCPSLVILEKPNETD